MSESSWFSDEQPQEMLEEEDDSIILDDEPLCLGEEQCAERCQFSKYGECQYSKPIIHPDGSCLSYRPRNADAWK